MIITSKKSKGELMRKKKKKKKKKKPQNKHSFPEAKVFGRACVSFKQPLQNVQG
jgi:hypothetical protein